MLKEEKNEEEIVSIAMRHKPPISHASSDVYVRTAGDIRHSGDTDRLIQCSQRRPLLSPPPTNPTEDKCLQLNFRGGYHVWHDKTNVAVIISNVLGHRQEKHPLGDTLGSRMMGWLTLT